MSAEPTIVVSQTFTLEISDTELEALKLTTRVAAICIKSMPESDLKLRKQTAALAVLGVIARIEGVGT